MRNKTPDKMSLAVKRNRKVEEDAAVTLPDVKTRVLSTPDTDLSTGGDTPMAILNRPLGPEFVQRRPGPGGSKLSYLSSSDAILVANMVFGNDRWSSEVLRQTESEPRQEAGKWVVDALCRIRVTVHWPTTKKSTFHEGTGYGGGSRGAKTPSEALEMAIKEAETDAFKRAMRKFGEALGNCFYDKGFLAWIEKQRAREGKYDAAKHFASECLVRKPTPATRSTKRTFSFDVPQKVAKPGGQPPQPPPPYKKEEDFGDDDLFEDDEGFPDL